MSGDKLGEFSFDIYVMRVLKQVHPDTGISGAALATMVNLVKINVSKVVKAANQLFIRSGVKTFTSRDVQSACRLVLPGELAKPRSKRG